MWFIGSFSLPTGIFREKKISWLFYFLFPSFNNNRLSSLTRFYRLHTPAFYYTFPPPHSYFFVERVMVITRELLSLSCVGPSIHFESHFHCARKEVPSKIKWNKLSVFSLFSPLAPSYVASAAASRSNSTKRISDVIAGCIWLCFVSRWFILEKIKLAVGPVFLPLVIFNFYLVVSFYFWNCIFFPVTN